MTKLFDDYKGLPKGLYVICFATLINRLGDFVVPFLSLYLTQKIGMSVGASGIIVTISSIIGIPAALIGGKVSDLYGRKKVYLYAQSISAFALIPCALTKNPAITIVCLLISTFFNGFIRPAFNSMITDMLSCEQRQAGFSLKYLSINVGVSVGPIIAGFLFYRFLPMLFIADAMTSFIAVFLIWKNVEETYESGCEVEVKNEAEREEKGNVFQLFWKRPYLFFFFLLYMVYSFIYTQHKFSLPLTLNEVFDKQGAKVFGYLMSVNAITVLLLTAFISAFTRRKHQLSNMALAGILYAIGFGMIGYVSHFGMFALSTIIWTGGEILCSISSGVYLANHSPSNYRARLNAMIAIGNSVGGALSTAVSGIYIQQSGVKNIWSLVFAISLIAATCMFALRMYMRKVDK
ncbi:MAG: MDR family MFS transporter [Velocimicrobium sp.]